jgi:hypothetical protein
MNVVLSIHKPTIDSVLTDLPPEDYMCEQKHLLRATGLCCRSCYVDIQSSKLLNLCITKHVSKAFTKPPNQSMVNA